MGPNGSWWGYHSHWKLQMNERRVYWSDLINQKIILVYLYHTSHNTGSYMSVSKQFWSVLLYWLMGFSWALGDFSLWSSHNRRLSTPLLMTCDISYRKSAATPIKSWSHSWGKAKRELPKIHVGLLVFQKLSMCVMIVDSHSYISDLNWNHWDCICFSLLCSINTANLLL